MNNFKIDLGKIESEWHLTKWETHVQEFKNSRSMSTKKSLGGKCLKLINNIYTITLCTSSHCTSLPIYYRLVVAIVTGYSNIDFIYEH